MADQAIIRLLYSPHHHGDPDDSNFFACNSFNVENKRKGLSEQAINLSCSLPFRANQFMWLVISEKKFSSKLLLLLILRPRDQDGVFFVIF